MSFANAIKALVDAGVDSQLIAGVIDAYVNDIKASYMTSQVTSNDESRTISKGALRQRAYLERKKARVSVTNDVTSSHNDALVTVSDANDGAVTLCDAFPSHNDALASQAGSLKENTPTPPKENNNIYINTPFEITSTFQENTLKPFQVNVSAREEFGEGLGLPPVTPHVGNQLVASDEKPVVAAKREVSAGKQTLRAFLGLDLKGVNSQELVDFELIRLIQKTSAGRDFSEKCGAYCREELHLSREEGAKRFENFLGYWLFERPKEAKGRWLQAFKLNPIVNRPQSFSGGSSFGGAYGSNARPPPLNSHAALDGTKAIFEEFKQRMVKNGTVINDEF